MEENMKEAIYDTVFVVRYCHRDIRGFIGICSSVEEAEKMIEDVARLKGIKKTTMEFCGYSLNEIYHE